MSDIDCPRCHPESHVDCHHTRPTCAEHRAELAEAFAEFRRLEREEARLMQEALDMGERRADQARLVQNLGGKL